METPNQPSGSSTQPAEPRTRRKKLLLRLGIGGLILLVVGGAVMGTAEYYTGQPDFCGSCHIMDPYYESWSKDVHAEKAGVKCVDCHYAPGQQHTLMAKFRGLSQLASYFSGRAGAGRPRAHVDDASCLTSECHGDEKYLTQKLTIGEARTEQRIVGGQQVEVQRIPTVTFVHEKHLRIQAAIEDTQQKIRTIETGLRGMTSAANCQRLDDAARAMTPVKERDASIKALAREAGLNAQAEADALELARLKHHHMRLRQLEGVKCAACHSYDAAGDDHFTVDRQACFICHFSNEEFNQGTGTCLNCHAPPTRKIAMHEPVADAQGGVTTMMEHQEVVERGISCASCHLDVVQPGEQITERDCAHCHDQERFMARFAKRTIEDVEEYHRVHVAGQRARCADCHHGVGHALVDPAAVATGFGFVQPVLDNCKHCHPNHHHEQVALLMGSGGAGLQESMPNAMFGSRLNCQACHTQSGTDFKGNLLVKATADTCVACHNEDYRDKLDQWISEMGTRLKETTAALAKAEEQLAQLQARNQAIPPAAQELLNEVRTNTALIERGNGVHNKNYAISLLDISDARLRQLDALLAGP